MLLIFNTILPALLAVPVCSWDSTIHLTAGGNTKPMATQSYTHQVSMVLWVNIWALIKIRCRLGGAFRHSDMSTEGYRRAARHERQTGEEEYGTR
jgi:hypothetical protein